MSWIMHDPDEWEAVTSSEIYGTYPGTDIPFGSANFGLRRRSPETVARIKAEKMRKEEDAILARAEAIKAKRAAHA